MCWGCGCTTQFFDCTDCLDSGVILQTLPCSNCADKRPLCSVCNGKREVGVLVACLNRCEGKSCLHCQGQKCLRCHHTGKNIELLNLRGVHIIHQGEGTVKTMKRKKCHTCEGVGEIPEGAWTSEYDAHDCGDCAGSGEEPFTVEELTIEARRFTPNVLAKSREDAKRLLSQEVERLGLTDSERTTFEGVVWRRFDKPPRGPGWS